MVVKELIEARWKAIICGLLALILVVVSAATYDLLKPALSNTSSQQMPQFLQQQVQQLTSSYNLYVWGNWFSKNGTEILADLSEAYNFVGKDLDFFRDGLYGCIIGYIVKQAEMEK